MIGYVTLGTHDLARAAGFYDELLALVGAKRMMEFDSFIAWSAGPDQPAIAATKPFNGEPATVGNGVMVALAAKDQAQVREIHEKALALGGADEGAPGPRGDDFYGAYFRDLDGNKLAAFCIG